MTKDSLIAARPIDVVRLAKFMKLTLPELPMTLDQYMIVIKKIVYFSNFDSSKSGYY